MVEKVIREGVYYFKKDVQRKVHCKMIFEQNLEKSQKTQIMGEAL